MRRITAALLAGALLSAWALPSGAATTTRISLTNTERPGNDGSFDPSISPNGRYVAFESRATNLVPNDADDNIPGIYLRDRVAGATKLISVNSAEKRANANSDDAFVSGNGKRVAFESEATNLAPKDAAGDEGDVFLRNLTTGKTTLVNVALNDEEPNNSAFDPGISADGTMVVFESSATNLVADDDNGQKDIFVRNLVTKTTTLVSETAGGTQGNDESESPVISTDGSAVAFESDANSFDGVEDPGDFDEDVFLKDLETGALTRISVSSDEAEGDANSNDASISATGNFVAFDSDATNFSNVDEDLENEVYIRDIAAGTTELVGVNSNEDPGTSSTYDSAVSNTGRYVAFIAEGPMVGADSNGKFDVYLRDRTDGITKRVSVAANGDQPVKDSDDPVITPDGAFVAFDSFAALVPPDRNANADVFLRKF